MNADKTSDGHERGTLRDAVEEIVRGGPDEFSSTVFTLAKDQAIEGCKTIAHCHFVVSDPNRFARVDALAKQLVKQVIYYAVPRTDIAKAQAKPDDRAVQAIIELYTDAVALFTDSQPNTGEGAELLLYALVEKYLRIPQVLSKMSLKTSRAHQTNGADGLHAKLEEDETLALYWGEAKLYAGISEAMSDCLDSVKPYLLGEQGDQDLYLLKHYSDTGDRELTLRLVEYFSEDSGLAAKVEMRAACLVGFGHDNYPCLPEDLEAIEEELKETMSKWFAGISTRVKNRKLTDFSIHFILFPLPSPDEFRDAIKAALRANQ